MNKNVIPNPIVVSMFQYREYGEVKSKYLIKSYIMSPFVMPGEYEISIKDFGWLDFSSAKRSCVFVNMFGIDINLK